MLSPVVALAIGSLYMKSKPMLIKHDVKISVSVPEARFVFGCTLNMQTQALWKRDCTALL